MDRFLNNPTQPEKMQIMNANGRLYEVNLKELDFSDVLRIAEFFQVSTDYSLGRTDTK